MFKKISLIISLLFILTVSHAFAQSHLESSAPKNSAVITQPLKKINDTVPSIHAYIVPGTVGLLIIIGLASYWLIYRRKHI